MADINVKTTDGTDIALGQSAITEFASNLRGELIFEGDAKYDEVRALWNGMIDRRPALIARCSGVADIVQSVKTARKHGLLVSVRGGGHWAREFFETMRRFATGGVYVNFVSEGDELVRTAYGPNYDRLVALKKRYDPANFFRINQNVRPAA